MCRRVSVSLCGAARARFGLLNKVNTSPQISTESLRNVYSKDIKWIETEADCDCKNNLSTSLVAQSEWQVGEKVVFFQHTLRIFVHKDPLIRSVN